METLPNLKKLLYMVGHYSFDEKKSLLYRLYGLFACFCMVIFLLPTIYLATKLNTVEQYAAFIPVTVGSCNAAFKGWIFLLYNNEVKSLLGNIQKTVDTQISNGRPDTHYKAANITSNFLVKGFRTVMFVCGWAAIIGTPLGALFHYFRGTLTPDKLQPPAPALMPYSLENLGAYIGTCVAFAVPINFWCFTIAAVDTFFMSLCVTFNSCFKDLMDMFDTDDLSEFSYRAANDKKPKLISVKDKLQACVMYHDEICSLIDQFQELVGPIIFAQYFFSLFQLGTLVFATVLIPGVEVVVKVFNVVLMVACLIELSTYCYFGNALTTTANDVTFAAYGCKWYDYDPIYRSYVLLAMIRAQKNTQIHGFYMVIASMETFSALINMIASVFTLLKSTVVQ